MESWLAERAREELELLESTHPGRFGYLKLELQALMSTPFGEFHLSDVDSLSPPISSSSAATQLSSNRKRKGDEMRDGDGSIEPEWKKRGRSKDRVDVAIEKAEACLRRIRQVKQSFLS